MTSILVGLGLFVLALFGAPLFVVIACGALLFFWSSGTNIVAVAGEHYRLASSPHLITIPLFTFAGFLLAKSEAADRLVRASRAFFGWMPGGLAVVVILSCAFFTTFTGASGVTIIALGGLLFPMLVQEDYPEDFSLGLITSSGSIGLLFPPSLPVILYGVVGTTDIDRLFVAGVFPGILMLSVLGGYSMFVGYRAKVPRHSWDGREAWESFWDAKWELLVPVVVLVGIYGGYVTVAEASAVAALYVLIIEVFLTGDIDLFGAPEEENSLFNVIRESMALVGAILMILGVAMGLTNYLVQEQVPMEILDFMQHYIESPIAFLILLNIFLLIVGCTMDIFSAIAVVVPLIAPIAKQYGIDEVHLGIIFLANLEIGYITPPVGLNLFISSVAFDKPVIRLYRVALPFFFLLLATLIIITFWPGLSLGLVEWVYGP